MRSITQRFFMRSRRFILATLVACSCTEIALSPRECRADVAVAADIDAPNLFILAPGRTAGWRFTVNASLELTHLGLYDWQGDGLQLSYAIGLWNQAGSMIIGVQLPAGTAAAELDGFRYTQIQSLTGIVLTPGQTYTIGYFASGVAPNDRMISTNGFHTLNPLLQQVGGGVITDTAGTGLMMPNAPFGSVGEQWFGPGFQFNVIPMPGASTLLIGVALVCQRRRRF